LPVTEIVRILATTTPFGAIGNYDNAPWIVVEIVRLPRILLVVLCGIGLALSGAAMQGVFRNPLVGPEIVGVSAGAAFGGVLAILLSFSSFGIAIMAFGFGMGALAAAFGLASLTRRASVLGLVLSGVIIGAFFGALVGLVEYTADARAQLPDIVYWLLGSFAGATYDKVALVAGATLIAGTLLMLLRWRINLLSLGETDAGALGVNVHALRWFIVGLVSLLVGAQVSVSGGVGWVGLIVPHAARMIVGPEHTRLLPVSALFGGFYLLAMDDIARSGLTQEIPIGILTAIIGTPIFGFLFWRTQARGWKGD
jgi:iron complex transport system permease protein